MQIIFMRHGEAVYKAANDGVRPLNELGKRQAFSTGEQLKTWLGSHQIDKILVSPYLRAQQTMEQVIQAAGLQAPIEEIDGLRPACNARDALEVIGDKAGECTLVVCHMSIVAFMVSILTGEEPVGFELAEARVLDMPVVAADQARLIHTLQPRQ